MEDEELLQVKRRHADRTSWEPKVGAFASIQRALGTKGKSYALARAAEVAGQVTQLEPGFCHVQLVANVQNLRRARLIGAGTLAAAAGAAAALGAVVPITLISPILFAGGAGLGIAAILVARRHRAQNEHLLQADLDALVLGTVAHPGRPGAGARSPRARRDPPRARASRPTGQPPRAHRGRIAKGLRHSRGAAPNLDHPSTRGAQ